MHRIVRLARGAVLALAIVLSAGWVAAQPDARAAIEEGNRQFSAALARGDSKALAAMYTAGARAFPPNADIVEGPEAIGRMWQSVIDAGIKGLELTTVDVEGQGDTAYEAGRYRLLGDGGKVLDQGKYVVVWKRDGGQWKLHRDIWNTSQPPAK
jgi:ketosteroid isomerase-like protein